MGIIAAIAAKKIGRASPKPNIKESMIVVVLAGLLTADYMRLVEYSKNETML